MARGTASSHDHGRETRGSRRLGAGSLRYYRRAAMSDPPEPDATRAYQPTPPIAPAGELFAPGALLAGRYRIVAALGKGGMGEVYRARDSRLDREVALKLLPGTYSTDAERLHRFEQEARAAGKLNHPN